MYLVRYSEIALKSDPVRRDWENRLIQNIKKTLETKNVRKERGRIWVEEGNPKKLKKVLGIQSFSPCSQCKLEDLESFSLSYSKKILKDKKTFGLKVKRVGNHDFTSKDIEKDLGGKILKEMPHLCVNLENPDKRIFIEIRNNNCYIFDKIISGPGGLPVGVSGRLLSLFSGNINSAVSSWMMMKRGCEITPIYFDCNDPDDFKRANELIKIIGEFSSDPYFNLKVFNAPIDKKEMFKVIEDIAEETGAKGIVTGECLSFPGSEKFIDSIGLNQLSKLPIYRPLVCLDKNDIETISERIGIK